MWAWCASTAGKLDTKPWNALFGCGAGVVRQSRGGQQRISNERAIEVKVSCVHATVDDRQVKLMTWCCVFTSPRISSLDWLKGGDYVCGWCRGDRDRAGD